MQKSTPWQLKTLRHNNLLVQVNQKIKMIPMISRLSNNCLCFFGPLENFSLIWRRHHCWWRATNFDLCSTLLVIEQWGLFNVPHLLWQRFNPLPSPGTRDTHTCCQAFGSGADTACFNDLGLSRPGIEPRSPALCECWNGVSYYVIHV